MGQFDSLGADINSVLIDVGVTATVTHTAVTEGTYDPATSAASLTTTSYTLNAVVGACRRELRAGVGVEAGDLKLIVMSPEFTVAPQLGDKFTVRSRGYTVVAIVDTEIGGALASHSIQLRRA